MVYEFRIPPYTKIIYLFKIKVYEFNIPFTKKVYEYRIPFESKRKPGSVPGIKPGFRVFTYSKLLLWQFSLPALIFACFVAISRLSLFLIAPLLNCGKRLLKRRFRSSLCSFRLSLYHINF